MSDVGRILLIKLLGQADRGGRPTVPINESSAKDYFSMSSLSDRDSVHAYLANAEVAGAVSLEWGRGAAAQDLLRIRLQDADRLAEWLGVPRARNHADQIEGELSEIAHDFPGWLRSAYDAALQEWRKGVFTLRIRAEDTEAAIRLFRSAYAVSRNEQAGLDLRSFSVRILNDSKAVENLLSKLAPLLRCNPEWEQFDDNFDLFRFLGLEKFSPPILIKGPLSIKYSGGDWDFSRLRPYVGISPDQVSEISATGEVPYLLTIENLASFQRHVREIDDNAVVIYTAGFPSPSLSTMLKWLDVVLPSECRFYHWGDRDVGGIRIFSQIENIMEGHSLNPHLMNEACQGEKAFDRNQLSGIGVYVYGDSKTAALARSWLENSLGSMEQELIDPASPVLEGGNQ